jgi:hypothetical protein
MKRIVQEDATGCGIACARRGVRAWLGLEGFWAGMLVTVACVAPLYFLFELLGRRFPLDQARDVAAPDQAGR